MPVLCLRANSPKKLNGDLKVLIAELGSTLFKEAFGLDLSVSVG